MVQLVDGGLELVKLLGLMMLKLVVKLVGWMGETCGLDGETGGETGGFNAGLDGEAGDETGCESETAGDG